MAARLRPDTGSVAVFIAAIMMILMGITALALDGGLLQLERNSAQNAADLAAMSAAWEECNGTGDPTSAALAAAATNGFDNVADNSVAVTKSGDEWTVSIGSSRTDPAFSGVLGYTDLDTSAEAVAECKAGAGGGYAIFANSQSCNNAVHWAGSTTTVDGAVHSNNDIKGGGSTQNVNGPGTYVNSYDASINWNGGISQVPVQPDPLSHISMSDYAPGGSKANAASAAGQYFNYGNSQINLSGSIAPGLYYTTARIKLNGSSVVADGATFVTDGGDIDLSTASDYLRPWDPDGVLFYTTYTKNCSTPAISISGSSHDWEGVIYAPNSRVNMSGSQNTALNASIVADTVKLTGAAKHISGWDGWAATPPAVGLRH